VLDTAAVAATGTAEGTVAGSGDGAGTGLDMTPAVYPHR